LKVTGLPETFWVVTHPSEVSTVCDICFTCTHEGLMRQALGGLKEDEIVGIYADEGEARKAAAELLGGFPVRRADALFVEVVVNVMVAPNDEEFSAKELAEAAVEAVRNAVRQGEEAGFRHDLQGRIALGAGTIVLRNQTRVTS